MFIWFLFYLSEFPINVIIKGVEMTKVNREYKDRLFRLLFGTEEMKRNILQLYNALNGSDYEDASELELTTIEDVIYIQG